ncbi:MAG: Glu/Leu/Phe/Val dehydrogenase [Hellea sp.]|nr:Glu/Leu/Phe/Val dehydrogenase [Hellea sp.]
MSVFDSSNFDDHESVHLFSDPESGLKAVIAVHSTARGPAAGGTRMWHYQTDQDAIDDALNLSRAMSYKNAMADIPFGGGKGVIIHPDGKINRRQLFEAYGRAIDSLGGIYCTAEDVGVSTSDMTHVSRHTKFVGGLDQGKAASGDPSPVTAEGVFRGLHVAVKNRLGVDSLSGLKVAVQGLGHVGYSLCEKLAAAGAKLWVADINQAAVKKAEHDLGATIVDPADIHAQRADIFAPCALGGAINSESIEEIKASIVGGAANNQLDTSDMGHALMRREILYCPDYVINGGGIINVAAELSGKYDPRWVDQKLDGLADTLAQIFVISNNDNRPTNEIADQMAQARINAAD